MQKTARNTLGLGVVLGAVLVVVGISAYVGSDFASITALIPAIFGGLVIVFGLVGLQTNRVSPAVYAVGIISLLGLLGSLRGLADVFALVTGDEVDSTLAATTQGAMILVCLVLLIAVVRYVRETR